MAAAGGIEAGKAYVRLYTDSSEYLRGLKSAENKLREFGSKVGSIGSSLARTAPPATPGQLAQLRELFPKGGKSGRNRTG